METDVEVCLFSLKYTTFIEVSDSYTFNAVTTLKGGSGLYTVPVVKEECINHVSKQLENCLRNLKKDLKVSVQTKKGKTMMRSQLAGKLDRFHCFDTIL